jgi:hypothetical protein
LDQTILNKPRGQILGQNPYKSLKSFLLAVHSHLYIFALRSLFLQTHATSNSFYSSVIVYIVKEKGRKPDRKPCPLPYGLRYPHRNLKPENAQDYAQKRQQNA